MARRAAPRHNAARYPPSLRWGAGGGWCRRGCWGQRRLPRPIPVVLHAGPPGGQTMVGRVGRGSGRVSTWAVEGCPLVSGRVSTGQWKGVHWSVEGGPLSKTMVSRKTRKTMFTPSNESSVISTMVRGGWHQQPPGISTASTTAADHHLVHGLGQGLVPIGVEVHGGPGRHTGCPCRPCRPCRLHVRAEEPCRAHLCVLVRADPFHGLIETSVIEWPLRWCCTRWRCGRICRR